MSKRAQHAAQVKVAEWMERADIEEMARLMREREDGIMPAKDRVRLEKELGIYRFGKWALSGDSAPGQHIKRQLEYRARIKESQTFYDSISPLNDDEGVAYDAVITAVLDKQERDVVKCVYQYFCAEETTARALSLDRYAVRVIRDRALRILSDAIG
jgi:hypothetical protein